MLTIFKHAHRRIRKLSLRSLKLRKRWIRKGKKRFLIADALEASLELVATNNREIAANPGLRREQEAYSRALTISRARGGAAMPAAIPVMNDAEDEEQEEQEAQ